MDRIKDFLDSINSPAQEAIFFSTEKSRQKAIGKFEEMDRSMYANVGFLEDMSAEMNPWLKDILAAENTADAQMAIMNKYHDKYTSIMNAKGVTGDLNKQWNKLFSSNAGMRLFQRADLKKEAVKDVEMKLVNKSLPNGEYWVRIMKAAEELHKFYPKLCSALEKTQPNTATFGSLQYLTQCFNLLGDLSVILAKRVNQQILRTDARKDNYTELARAAMNNASESIFDMFAQEAILFSTEKSRGKVINDFAAMDRAINAYITRIENLIELLEPAMNDIRNADDTVPAQQAVSDKYSKPFWDTITKARNDPDIKESKELLRRNGETSRFRIRADLKQGEVQAAERALVEKCSTGEYSQRMTAITKRMTQLREKICAFAASVSDTEVRIVCTNSVVVYMWNWIEHEIVATGYDIRDGVLRLKMPEKKRYSFGTLGLQ